MDLSQVPARKSAAIRAYREYSHRTIAMIYDFDGTLSPLSMQEYTVFPELNIDPKTFWPEVKRVTKENQASEVLTYMRMMAERIVQGNVAINREKLGALGSQIEYFPGVESWFDRMNRFVRDQTLGYVKLRHYIVSSGLREILQGTSIAKHFHSIFASGARLRPRLAGHQADAGDSRPGGGVALAIERPHPNASRSTFAASGEVKGRRDDTAQA